MSKTIKHDFKISSLQEYIDIIEKLETDAYRETHSPILYRGESKNYYKDNNNQPTFTSSAFRERPIEGYENEGKIPFKAIVEEFRKEIWLELNNDSRKNFLAYSQHHGIKTNLLDFTTNPLVALYFAVRNKNDDEAFVYIKKEPTLDITALFGLTDQQNILDIINGSGKNNIEFLKESLTELAAENFDYFENKIYVLCLDYYRLINKNNSLFFSYENKNKVDEVLRKIYLKDQEQELIIKTKDIAKEKVSIRYLIALRGFIRAKNDVIMDSSDFNGVLPMIYRPIMSFKRGINQNGVFLTQNYILSSGNFLMGKQNLEPNLVISVTNKNKILKTLDTLNINKKVIYGDHTSIAEYINEKNNEKRNVKEKLSSQF